MQVPEGHAQEAGAREEAEVLQAVHKRLERAAREAAVGGTRGSTWKSSSARLQVRPLKPKTPHSSQHSSQHS